MLSLPISGGRVLTAEEKKQWALMKQSALSRQDATLNYLQREQNRTRMFQEHRKALDDLDMTFRTAINYMEISNNPELVPKNYTPKLIQLSRDPTEMQFKIPERKNKVRKRRNEEPHSPGGSSMNPSTGSQPLPFREQAPMQLELPERRSKIQKRLHREPSDPVTVPELPFRPRHLEILQQQLKSSSDPGGSPRMLTPGSERFGFQDQDLLELQGYEQQPVVLSEQDQEQLMILEQMSRERWEQCRELERQENIAELTESRTVSPEDSTPQQLPTQKQSQPSNQSLLGYSMQYMLLERQYEARVRQHSLGKGDEPDAPNNWVERAYKAIFTAVERRRRQKPDAGCKDVIPAMKSPEQLDFDLIQSQGP